MVASSLYQCLPVGHSHLIWYCLALLKRLLWGLVPLLGLGWDLIGISRVNSTPWLPTKGRRSQCSLRQSRHWAEGFISICFSVHEHSAAEIAGPSRSSFPLSPDVALESPSISYSRSLLPNDWDRIVKLKGKKSVFWLKLSLKAFAWRTLIGLVFGALVSSQRDGSWAVASMNWLWVLMQSSHLIFWLHLPASLRQIGHLRRRLSWDVCLLPGPLSLVPSGHSQIQLLTPQVAPALVSLLLQLAL